MAGKTTYDAIVIGAGPGGVVCARELAAMGDSVLVVDSGKKGRVRPSAGGIPPRNYTVTPLKEDLIERAVNAGFFCTAHLNTFMIQADDDVGAIVYRAEFDKYMCDLAVKAGAKVKFSTEVTGVEFKDDLVQVEVKDSRGERKISARSVVGAFGCGSNKLNRIFGIEHKSFFESLMIEMELPEDQVEDMIGPAAETYLDSAITTLGRIWIYPKRAGAAVGINSAGAGNREKLAASLKDFIENHPVGSVKLHDWKPKYKTVEDSTFFNCIPRLPVKKSYGDRFVLVGDAAGAADPLTGEGIYHAQRTGYVASRVLHKCLVNDALDEESLSEYQKKWHRSIVHADTCYNLKSANILFDCPHQDDVIEALLHAAEGNERVREAMLWVFAGLRSQREAMKHCASPRLIFQILKKLSPAKAVPLIPRILKTYSLSDLL